MGPDMSLTALVRKVGNAAGLKPVLLRVYRFVQWLFHGRHNVIKRVDGIRYQLDLNELIDSSIYFQGAFERESVAAVQRYLKPGDVALDIGANIGCYALLFSKIVGEHGKVVAFEPMGWAWRKLTRNKGLNAFTTNLVLEKCAVGDRPATAQRVRFRTSWRIFGADDPPQEEVVDVVTLDQYVEEHLLEKVDFIKLDVDGFEYKVVRGGKRTLLKYRPIFMLELGSYTLESTGDRLEDLVDCLYDLGYAILWEKGLYRFKDRAEVTAAVPPDSTINVICVPSPSPQEGSPPAELQGCERSDRKAL